MASAFFSEPNASFDHYQDAFGGGIGEIEHRHIYALPGVYQISLDISDDDDGRSSQRLTLEVVETAAPEPDVINEVRINLDGDLKTAQGSSIGANTSDDSNQYIFCRVQVSADANPYMVCESRDADVNTLTCLGTNGYVYAVLDMPDYATIRFSAIEDSSGVSHCNFLEIGNFAHNLP